MKRLLFSMVIMFAFALTSNAQEEAALPDLVVTGWGVPTSVNQGPNTVIEVTIYVANLGLGASPAGSAIIQGQFQDPSVSWSYLTYQWSFLPAIGPQTSSSFKVTMNINSTWYPNISTGTIYCTLDQSNNIPETNENNNYSVSPMISFY